ncbi:MAG: hypothetical protein H2B05_03125 [Nitrosopumilaceae archaeon]|uniref:Uncharacterized protein n=1 Tax=Candidatus Nitrosomaritimum aestuariumsis TaxID=3342354 RepID=A0AC60W2N5_9ARCH|nr:hypothetical protein [Nitrosopumilaceae archaeon]
MQRKNNSFGKIPKLKKPKINTKIKNVNPKRKTKKKFQISKKPSLVSKQKPTIQKKKTWNNTSKNKSSTNTKIIQEKILELKRQQKSLLEKIRNNLKKIQDSSISLSGLEHLSEKSVSAIQKKRSKEAASCQQLMKKISLISDEISRWELKYKKSLDII